VPLVESSLPVVAPPGPPVEVFAVLVPSVAPAPPAVVAVPVVAGLLVELVRPPSLLAAMQLPALHA
jgi:hypothetical protein